MAHYDPFRYGTFEEGFDPSCCPVIEALSAKQAITVVVFVPIPFPTANLWLASDVCVEPEKVLNLYHAKSFRQYELSSAPQGEIGLNIRKPLAIRLFAEW
jgi:hypothetical protein